MDQNEQITESGSEGFVDSARELSLIVSHNWPSRTITLDQFKCNDHINRGKIKRKEEEEEKEKEKVNVNKMLTKTDRK